MRLRGDDALAALNASADAIVGVDESGRCVFANAAAGRAFGYRPGELPGIGVQLLVPQLAGAVRRLTERRRHGDLAVGPTGEGADLVAVRRSGTTFPARIWLAPTFARGRVVVLATVRDLSAEQAAVAATRALLGDVHDLRAVVAAITSAVTECAILVTDPYGHITVFNRAAEKLLGYRAEEVAGRPLLMLSDPADIDAARAELRTPADADPLLEITRSGLPNRQHWCLLTRDGQRRQVELRIVPVGDREDPSGFVCLAATAAAAWEPLTPPRQGRAARQPRDGAANERLLLDLDDAETRTLRWQVGGQGMAKRR